MKRFFLISSLAFLLSACGFSQAVEQGNMLFDASYGWPNLYTNTFKQLITNSTDYNIKATGFGPAGIKFEYMVADKIGFGVIINYASSALKFNEDQQVYNSGTGLYDNVTYHYSFTVPRYRIMPKFSFHYGNSDIFDGYTTIAVGYGGYSFNWTSDDPTVTNDTWGINILPVAFRLATGGRIFFSPHVGANIEFGLGGGGLIEFGLSAKI